MLNSSPLRLASFVVPFVSAAPVASAADVLVVDAAGGGAYTSIQAAVSASQEGDIVLVRAGVYTEEVRIDGRSLTVVGEGDPRLVGHLVVRNLDSADVVQLSGLSVAPPQGVYPYEPYVGALDVRLSRGAVRVQDCRLLGANDEGRSPYYASPHSPDGGCGLLAVMCEDLAVVDCMVAGGEGGLSAVAVSGYGGDAVVAHDVTHLSLVRTVVRGGRGGLGDDPGHGGSGARLVGPTALHVAYSALFGGTAGCWAGWVGTPSWINFGGDGLIRGAGTTTFDFEGLYFSGEAASPQCVPQHSGVGSFPGSPQSGSGALTSLDGYPNTLHAPRIVREAQPWSLEVVGPTGERGQVLYAGTTGFRFRPALEQPRLVGAPWFLLVGAAALLPASQRLLLPQAPFLLPAGVEGDVVWLQAVVGPVGGAATFSSARFVVRLDAAL